MLQQLTNRLCALPSFITSFTTRSVVGRFALVALFVSMYQKRDERIGLTTACKFSLLSAISLYQGGAIRAVASLLALSLFAIMKLRQSFNTSRAIDVFLDDPRQSSLRLDANDITNTRGFDFAEKASERLQCLTLVGSPDGSPYVSSAQLHSFFRRLKECRSMEQLEIRSFPFELDWALIKEKFPHLKVLKITSCNTEAIDAKDFTLKSLEIKDCHQLARIANLTTEKLRVEGCKKFSSLTFKSVSSLSKLAISGCPILPSLPLRDCVLEECELVKCPMLKWTSSALTCCSLERLDVRDCPLMNVPSLFDFTSARKLKSLRIRNSSLLCSSERPTLRQLPKLSELEIGACLGFETFMKSLDIDPPFKMIIDSCNGEILRLGEEPFQELGEERFQGLRHLEVKDCKNLEKLVLPQNGLLTLKVEGCPSLEGLPKQMPPSIEEITICGCEKFNPKELLESGWTLASEEHNLKIFTRNPRT